MNNQERDEAIKALQVEIKIIKNLEMSKPLSKTLNRHGGDILNLANRQEILKSRVDALYGITTKMQQGKDNYTHIQGGQCDCPSCRASRAKSEYDRGYDAGVKAARKALDFV